MLYNLLNKVKNFIYNNIFLKNTLLNTTIISGPVKLDNSLNKPNESNRALNNESMAFSKNDLLDNLDLYFKYIKKMRSHDRDAYEFYKKLGGQLLWGEDVSQTIEEWTTLPTRWTQVRPSFGCVFVEDDKVTKSDIKVRMRFVYFKKYTKNMSNVQKVPIEGEIYAVSALYSFADEKGNEREHLIQYPVLITKNNECRVLLMKQIEDITIKSKRPGYNKGEFTIRRQKWSLPDFALLEAKIKNISPEEIILRSFCFAAHCYEIAQQQMIEVRATKGNICARFTIKGNITSDLFKERELTGNRKKKIFHSVRPHVRKNGSVIKMHFRGERKFTWNGYSIVITVPGKDYQVYMPEISFAGTEYNNDEPIPRDMVDDDYVAKKLVEITTHAVE